MHYTSLAIVQLQHMSGTCAIPL